MIAWQKKLSNVNAVKRWKKSLSSEMTHRCKIGRHPCIGYHQTTEHKLHNSLSNKGKHSQKKTKKWRKNISISTTGWTSRMTIEQYELLKKQRSLISSKLWKDKKYQETVVKAIVKTIHPNMGKAEQHLDSILQKNFPNEWKYVGSGDFILGGKNPDFMNVNGKKLLIELYEDYFHKCWGTPSKQRIEYFKKFGFNTLIVWEHELSDDAVLMDKISNFMS